MHMQEHNSEFSSATVSSKHEGNRSLSTHIWHRLVQHKVYINNV
uniref:Uncharacterized protein n=1 Tax=Setaria italica TaxID=4555 RepID=K4A3W0_SETIT